MYSCWWLRSGDGSHGGGSVPIACVFSMRQTARSSAQCEGGDVSVRGLKSQGEVWNSHFKEEEKVFTVTRGKSRFPTKNEK